MVNITIDPQLKEVWQQAALGCVQCRVVVQPSSRQLLEAIDVVCRRLMDSMSIEQIKQGSILHRHVPAVRHWARMSSATAILLRRSTAGCFRERACIRLTMSSRSTI